MPNLLRNLLPIDFFANAHSWFVYDKANPLLFNSALFLFLFLCFYFIYALVKSQRLDIVRKIYVILFSIFFYYKAGGTYFVLLLICAVVTDLLARKMYTVGHKNRPLQKGFLAVIIVANLGMLAYYKYTGFLAQNINALFHCDFSFGNIVLPIGISFFVFEAISYAVDLYRDELKPAKNTLDFCFYICFFPKLIAGPIIRAKDFLPQMEQRLHLTREDAAKALFLILIGLIKKAVISDYISGNFVDRIFDSPLRYTSIENLLAVYGYTLQIFCDFSGYSDIAIGLSLLMGFKIPENFRTPYKSSSLTEFWRRWHISLSSWLRDYLYISMGGNRKSKIRTYVNLILTMLIGGLWHGASWKFVMWGGLHGVLLAIERFCKQLFRLPDTKLMRFVCGLLTFHFVAFCWIFFRAGSFKIAGNVLSNISSLSFVPSEWITVFSAYRNVFLLMVIGYVMHFLPESFVNHIKRGFTAMPLVGKAILGGFVFWLILATASSAPQPFIYFQF